MSNKKYEKAVSELMSAVTTLTGLPVIWKDADGHATESLPPNQQRHRNPFCDRVKNASARLKRCSLNDTAEIAILAEQKKHPFIHHCHAGVDELVTPIFIDGVYTGAFFLGPFRAPNAECVYAQCQKEFDRLPLYNAETVAAAGRILRLLEFTAGHHAKTMALQESLNDESCSRLHPALEYIDRHFSENISVSDVAVLCHLSPSRFMHLFKEKMNTGFSGYLCERRLEEAKSLLSNTGMKIGDIACRCGFTGQSYFSMIFRRRTGKTPAAYRVAFKTGREP